MDAKEKENNLIKELIETGSEITGSISGAAVGGAMAGPVGYIIGGAIGPIISRVFRKIGISIKTSYLGNREEARIGATYALAVNKIKIKLENGEKIRDDDFFTSMNENRSAAEEILEGVLLTVKQEYEEKKLKYYANLLANIAFSDSINRARANFLLKLAQRISYQQLCITNHLYNLGTLHINKYWEPLFLKNPELQDLTDFYTEITELDQMQVLACVKTPVGYIQKISVSVLGKVLYNLMELKDLDKNDMLKVVEKFTESDKKVTEIPIIKSLQKKIRSNKQYESTDISESEIKVKAKSHQSMFREEILKVESKIGFEGYKLSEKEASLGKNFYLNINGLFDEILKYRPFKKDDQVFYNMISSRHIAYNFFIPIKLIDIDLAKYIINEYLNDSISQIIKIEFEYLHPQSRNYFPKIFPFDVYVEYLHKDNSKGAIGIELIYTEGKLRFTGEFEQKLSDPNSSYNILTKESNIFKSESIQELQEPIYHKLWLKQLLGEQILKISELNIKYFTSLVIYPSKHIVFSNVCKSYKNLIKQDLQNIKFCQITFEDFIQIAKNNTNKKNLLEWLDYLEKRYLF